MIFIIGCEKIPQQEVMKADDIAFRKEGIDVSTIKKIPIEDPILNNSKYCNFDLDSEDCVCQKNYVKVVNGYPYCISKLCTLVGGFTRESEDMFFPNYRTCSSALIAKDYTICQLIADKLGQDICILNIVGNTNNLSLCQFIQNNTLRTECET